MNWRYAYWPAAAVLLLIPALAMLRTSEMHWGPEDFLCAAALLLTAGLAYEAATRFISAPRQRLLAAIAIGVIGLLVWAHLAVHLWD